MSELDGCECALVGCGADAVGVFCHQHRPERETSLCSYHAEHAGEAGVLLDKQGVRFRILSI